MENEGSLAETSSQPPADSNFTNDHFWDNRIMRKKNCYCVKPLRFRMICYIGIGNWNAQFTFLKWPLTLLQEISNFKHNLSWKPARTQMEHTKIKCITGMWWNPNQLLSISMLFRECTRSQISLQNLITDLQQQGLHSWGPNMEGSVCVLTYHTSRLLYEECYQCFLIGTVFY